MINKKIYVTALTFILLVISLNVQARKPAIDSFILVEPDSYQGDHQPSAFNFSNSRKTASSTNKFTERAPVRSVAQERKTPATSWPGMLVLLAIMLSLPGVLVFALSRKQTLSKGADVFHMKDFRTKRAKKEAEKQDYKKAS